MKHDLGFIHIYQPPKNGSLLTILVLHGTGGDENSLLPIAGALDPDAGVLSVRGKVLENGAPRFFRRLAEGVFDLEDLNVRTHELADFVESAHKAYQFDADRVIAAGYSNGANIGSSLLFLRPESLGGAILLRAMVPFEPTHKHDLSAKRVFLSEGKYDPLVPHDNAEHLAHLLREQGAQVTLNWADLDHQLGRSDIDAAKDWLKRA
jgi:phospholipase/carboxylesterase